MPYLTFDSPTGTGAKWHLAWNRWSDLLANPIQTRNCGVLQPLGKDSIEGVVVSVFLKNSRSGIARVQGVVNAIRLIGSNWSRHTSIVLPARFFLKNDYRGRDGHCWPPPAQISTITRGQGDWLGLSSYSFIRYLSPACADAPGHLC